MNIAKHVNKFVFVVLIMGVWGCKNINSSIMFKTPEEYKFSEFKPGSDSIQYKIAPNDLLSFQLFSNDGFKLLDITAITAGGAVNQGILQYSVEQNGEVKFPVLGRVKLAGLTVREAELFLEQKFSLFYQKPFVIVKVVNKRVFIFPGAASAARVVNLVNENTTLIEAITLSGGLAVTAKAWRVKLIRGSLKNPEVYLIDLSTLDGVKKADMFVQANDIIYVEQIPNIAQGILAQVAPYLTILSTISLITTLLVRTRQI